MNALDRSDVVDAVLEAKKQYKRGALYLRGDLLIVDQGTYDHFQGVREFWDDSASAEMEVVERGNVPRVCGLEVCINIMADAPQLIIASSLRADDRTDERKSLSVGSSPK
jgi:hypothetical protein